jgi:hypothetical protein
MDVNRVREIVDSGCVGATASSVECETLEPNRTMSETDWDLFTTYFMKCNAKPQYVDLIRTECGIDVSAAINHEDRAKDYDLNRAMTNDEWDNFLEYNDKSSK